MKKIITKLENANIATHKYKEDGKLCGYELNTYTNGGLNQIVFVDFRDTDKKPNKVADFKELFLERVKSIDTDEEVEINRQNKQYCNDFTLRESLDDIEEWKQELLTLAESL
jgi:hypothetical protein